MRDLYQPECKHTLRRHSTVICSVAGIELTVHCTSLIHDRTKGYLNSSERNEGLLKGKPFTCRRG